MEVGGTDRPWIGHLDVPSHNPAAGARILIVEANWSPAAGRREEGKAFAIELGPLKIRVNAILPGAAEGDRIRGVFGAKAQVRGVSLQTIADESMACASIKEMISPQQLAD